MIKNRNTFQSKPSTLPVTLGKVCDEVKEKKKKEKQEGDIASDLAR